MRLETIPIEKITSNPMQPREKFDREKLDDLAESIRTVGMKVPVIVRPKGRQYELVSGQRRWEAAKAAKMIELTAIVKELDDKELAIESLIANEFRENLDPWERAKFLKRIKKMANLDSDMELGKLVGMSKSAIQTAWEYLDVDEEVKEKVSHGVLSARSAREIGSIPDKEVQRRVADIAEKQDMTVKETQNLVQVVKKAPEPIKQAILKEKIDTEDVKPIIDIGITERKVPRVVEELTERKKMREMETKAQRELDKAYARGELEADKIRIIRSKDEQIRDGIRKVRDTMMYMPSTALKEIQTEKIRQEGIRLVQDIAKAAERMLQYVES